MPHFLSKLAPAFLLAVELVFTNLTSAAEIEFGSIELPTKVGVGYAVRLVDMNGDKRLDICVVDQERILWLENPNWTEHILIDKQTKKDNVCFGTYDIDGDGQVDFAVGADWRPFDTASGGTIQWITKTGAAGPLWKVLPIGEVPTVHRLNWADLDGDGKAELIVAPLMGRNSTKPDFAEKPCELLAFPIPADPVKGPWVPQVISQELHVMHNFVVTDFNHDGKPDILAVAFEGVFLLERTPEGKWTHMRVGTGNQATTPNRGASEIKHGLLKNSAGKQSDYIATIEPWHGHQVVVYTPPAVARPATGEWLWQRTVLDEELKWGHAVACVNLDDDDDQELVIGIRDTLDAAHPCGLRIYDPIDAAAGKWQRQLVDPGSVAVEDLATGDLNGDGRNDIVAVGRATHNIKVYFNQSKP